jgi:hypothetical protein
MIMDKHIISWADEHIVRCHGNMLGDSGIYSQQHDSCLVFVDILPSLTGF